MRSTVAISLAVLASSTSPPPVGTLVSFVPVTKPGTTLRHCNYVTSTCTPVVGNEDFIFKWVITFRHNTTVYNGPSNCPAHFLQACTRTQQVGISVLFDPKHESPRPLPHAFTPREQPRSWGNCHSHCAGVCFCVVADRPWIVKCVLMVVAGTQLL